MCGFAAVRLINLKQLNRQKKTALKGRMQKRVKELEAQIAMLNHRLATEQARLKDMKKALKHVR
jgi:phage terminase Nu1 subunit (DNA packaging protein)